MDIQSIFNQAFKLHQAGQLQDALALYQQIQAPLDSNAHFLFLFGTLYGQMGQLETAVEVLEKSISLNPLNPDAFNNRGKFLKDLNRLDEALTSYDKAIALKPDFAEAYSNRGIALQELNRLDEALTSYDKAIALKPDYAEAYSNRGIALQELKRLDEAVASYDKAIALKPDYADAYWNKSVLLTLTGKYQDGWELNEWRLKRDDVAKSYYRFPQLAWRGHETINGKQILIHSEQGLGDVIQFCRYLPQVRTLGAEIIFEVPKVLVSLVSTLDCPMTIIAKGDKHPEFDAYCPIMSLPYVFKTTVETIPNRTPYLFSDREKVKQFQDKLGPKERLRVGIVWTGSTGHKNDKNRSIKLEQLSGLFELPVEFHSIQKEYRNIDKEFLEQHSEIIQHQDELNDFSDTAALIECMDLVISVDTSVVHVAGAIGKTVWVMLPFMPDYRWMLDRDDSPWYPTAKLFRQPELDDWDSVIKAINGYLRRLMN